MMHAALIAVVGLLGGVTALAPAGAARVGAPAGPGSAGAAGGGPVPQTVWDLFVQSMDLFTWALLVGSVATVGLIFRAAIETRRGVILPAASGGTIRRLIDERKWDELRGFVRRDGSFASEVVRAAMGTPERGPRDRAGARDAADLAASALCARWFRSIEPLNVLGNLGPLIGLAGTTYGMVLAFTSLGAASGQASPAALSVGIAKALFHTLLGLLLAIPSLMAYGLFRQRVDRLCNDALVMGAELVEMLPDPAPHPPLAHAPASASNGAHAAAAAAAGAKP
ncbi:MAG: hypothetical protein C0475_07420 [Planctomyces sp.]|nr:hypothetical protein [Planctomyces sp.]